MKTQHHHEKLRTTTRPLFSCGFFRHCTESPLSPTAAASSSSSHLPPPPPPPPSTPPPPPPQPRPTAESGSSSSSSSSASTSQSFTLWKFPIPSSPILPPPPPPESRGPPLSGPSAALHSDPPPPPAIGLDEVFRVAQVQFSTGTDWDGVSALHFLERSLVPDPPADNPPCPPAVMSGVVGHLRRRAGAKPATKVLLALCLGERNRRVAIEAGAVGAVVEAAADLEGAAAERALAALELMCTVAEGAAELRAHALTVPMMVEVMGRTAARGKEYAIGVLAVMFSGTRDQAHAPPEEVARAVALALKGDCSSRGRRKGAQLLKILEEVEGDQRLDFNPS